MYIVQEVLAENQRHDSRTQNSNGSVPNTLPLSYPQGARAFHITLLFNLLSLTSLHEGHLQ